MSEPTANLEPTKATEAPSWLPTPTRRAWLQSQTAVAVATAFTVPPTIVPATVFAKDDQPAPSDRFVVGMIGTGDLGRRHHLNNMLLPRKDVAIAAVCDVDANHRNQAAIDTFKKSGRKPAVYHDFRHLCDRTDIDVVFVVTPDHWHTLASLAAVQSGKDVYCEKPLTLTIAEGKRLVEVVRQYEAVFQTGSQQRSDGSGRFQKACMLARNGHLGKLQRMETFIGGIDSGSWQAPTTPPPELDWNFWLGQAPYVDYTPNRCHYQFRWFQDYSGGKMTDWGAHHNDIAQWAVGMDDSGPIKVKGQGKRHDNGPHDVFTDFHIEYTYDNGVELHCFAQGKNGIKIIGSDGWVFVNRGEIEASDPELLKLDFDKMEINLLTSRHHHDNFFNCVRTRQRPICDVQIGHRSATVCHLGNIAMELGRELKWDPAQEQFVDDEQANEKVSRPMRAPWHL